MSTYEALTVVIHIGTLLIAYIMSGVILMGPPWLWRR